mgnify:CR=1 FL=1
MYVILIFHNRGHKVCGGESYSKIYTSFPPLTLLFPVWFLKVCPITSVFEYIDPGFQPESAMCR